MGLLITKLGEWYDKYIVQIRGPSAKLIDPIFHHHKIKIYGYDLRNQELSLEERGRAALHIGLLCYTGGVSAAELASEYIPDMTDILQMQETPGKASISVIKGLCGICYINPVNQNKAKENHLAEILLAYMDENDHSPNAEPDSIFVKFWICYLMTIVCCNNTAFLALFNEMGGERLEKKLEHLSAMEWFGWPQNYAKMFLLMAYPQLQTNM